jgi:oxygen-independent coproporphyrinogen-3 oxidase
MLEVDEESRLGREMLNGGARYYAELVPTDDAIAEMYARAIERLGDAELAQYEISNFSAPHFHSRHNLRYWERRPYLGVGLDASSALHSLDRGGEQMDLLRAKTTDELTAYLDGPQAVETAWLSPAQQFEEAWFLGLRLNAGVDIAALEREFGSEMAAAAREVVDRLAEDELVRSDSATVRLTARGRLVSNDVFQEFLGLGAGELTR